MGRLEVYKAKAKELLDNNFDNLYIFKKRLDDYIYILNDICKFEPTLVYSVADVNKVLQSYENVRFSYFKDKYGRDDSVVFFYWVLKYFISDEITFSDLFSQDITDWGILATGAIKIFADIFDDESSVDGIFNDIGKTADSMTNNNMKRLKSEIIVDFIKAVEIMVEMRVDSEGTGRLISGYSEV